MRKSLSILKNLNPSRLHGRCPPSEPNAHDLSFDFLSAQGPFQELHNTTNCPECCKPRVSQFTYKANNNWPTRTYCTSPRNGPCWSIGSCHAIHQAQPTAAPWSSPEASSVPRHGVPHFVLHDWTEPASFHSCGTRRQQLTNGMLACFFLEKTGLNQQTLSNNS